MHTFDGVHGISEVRYVVLSGLYAGWELGPGIEMPRFIIGVPSGPIEERINLHNSRYVAWHRTRVMKYVLQIYFGIR